MNKLLKISVIAFAASVGACVSMSSPIPVGHDKYMITLDAHGGFHGSGKLMEQSVERANNFCSSLGRRAEIVSDAAFMLVQPH